MLHAMDLWFPLSASKAPYNLALICTEAAEVIRLKVLLLKNPLASSQLRCGCMILVAEVVQLPSFSPWLYI